MSTALDLHYTEREELSEEEIFDEGFTPDDDYRYKGQLNSVWIKPLQQLFDKTRWTSKDIEDGGITVTAIEKGKDEGVKIPSNQEEWQLMAQDLIQAIYETAKKRGTPKNRLPASRRRSAYRLQPNRSFFGSGSCI
ncbi:hypothetical protein [Algoriphagus boritolerans]|uniref:hypothetical protein n=1 Tax=Algoriphagus boritolerans TaxID=308111 RepID=UPI002FCE1A89